MRGIGGSGGGLRGCSIAAEPAIWHMGPRAIRQDDVGFPGRALSRAGAAPQTVFFPLDFVRAERVRRSAQLHSGSERLASRDAVYGSTLTRNAKGGFEAASSLRSVTAPCTSS